MPEGEILKSTKVNPELANVLEELGASGIRKCYDCGTCTASCPFSEEFGGEPFPRRIIKYAKLGVEDRLTSSLEPWLCYYCGDCSNSCPKGAESAEIMMAVRRYLTTKYDFTGLAKFIYFSRFGWLLATIAVAGIALLAGLIFMGPIVTERTMLETFAPLHVVEGAGIVLLIVLASVLLTNVYRMFRFTVGNLEGIPLSKALRELVIELPKNFLTQIRFSKCTTKSYWYVHLMIFYGYALSFLLFVILLRYTLTNEPFLFVHPLSILGILSTIILLFGAFTVIKGRLEKKELRWKYSHHTDWMFVGLLTLVVITGILTGIFRTLNYPILTYSIFMLHLMLSAPFLALEVPFAKWSHLAYRTFAVYFMRLKMLKERGGGA